MEQQRIFRAEGVDLGRVVIGHSNDADDMSYLEQLIEAGSFIGMDQALWRIVMVRMVHDPRTRSYVERRTREGRSKREIIRSLKRYVARQLYRHLPRVKGPA